MTRTVLFAAGGTAGHVVPALAVADELGEAGTDITPVFVGVEGRLEDRLVPSAGYPLLHVPAVPLVRRPSPRLFGMPSALLRAERRAVQIARETDAVAVLAFGGYVSFPAARAARRVGLPLVLHEQNSIPGLSNRVAARWADRVAVSFAGTIDRMRHPERCVVTGSPVAKHLHGLDRLTRRPQAAARLEIDPELPTVLVFGGSQGARSINDAVVAAFARWRDLGVQLVHVTGAAGFEPTLEAWRAAAAGAPRGSVVEYLDDMADAYAVADLVVCRAGATSVAELAAVGLPSILVPYPNSAGDHQLHNARALERIGAAQVLRDSDLARGRLPDMVAELVVDRARLASMGAAARAWSRPEAARAIARVLLDVLDREDA
jgi:UDP-N-acetylglucosamine--N-acetylmuramyl-(pentapeptide) pyrophosphoryl-undecaprenol N-acetylglucosamine transferase